MNSKGWLDKLQRIDSNYNKKMDIFIKEDLFKDNFKFGNMTENCLRLCHVLCHKELSYRKLRYSKEIILNRHKKVSKLLNIPDDDMEVSKW